MADLDGKQSLKCYSRIVVVNRFLNSKMFPFGINWEVSSFSSSVLPVDVFLCAYEYLRILFRYVLLSLFSTFTIHSRIQKAHCMRCRHKNVLQENERVWKVKELFLLFTDVCLVVMESDKEGNKISSKPSSAVFPHKKMKKSNIPAADPASMQNYIIFKGDREQIWI